MIRALFIMCVGVLLPTASAAQQMNSENFSIDAGVVEIGGDGSPSSANFSLNDAFGESITSDFVPSVPSPSTEDAGGGTTGGGGRGSTQVSSPCDIVADGVSDILDFNSLMVHWGETGAGNVADCTSDNVVDIFDFNLLMVSWGT